jgi:hypothetical protein
LALQPVVGFGLSNNVPPVCPICHQLSPSSRSQHLKISFYFSPSCPRPSSSFRPFQSFYALLFQMIFFPSGIPTKAVYAPPLSPIRVHLIILELMTRITFGEEYRSWGILEGIGMTSSTQLNYLAT